MAESQIERKLLWTEKQIESLHDQVAKLKAENERLTSINSQLCSKSNSYVIYNARLEEERDELKRQLDLANKRCALLGISK